jgi:hypothetical protein
MSSSALVLLGVLSNSGGPSQTAHIDVALMPPVTAGIASHLPPKIAERLSRSLGRAEVPVTDFSEKCSAFDVDCVERTAAGAVSQGATHVVRMSVSGGAAGVDADHQIQIELTNRTGDILATAEDVCELCGDAELLERAEGLAAVFRARVDRLASDPAGLVIEGSPPGATVFIDGESVGAVPFDGRLGPGPHELRVEADGYVGYAREIDLSGASTEHLQIDLAESAGPGPGGSGGDRADRAALQPAGWAILASGIGGAGAGAALVALDGRPHQPTCPMDLVDRNGSCPNLYTTMAGGAVGLVAGGLAIAAGVTLVVVGKKRETSTTVGATTRGFFVRGRF